MLPRILLRGLLVCVAGLACSAAQDARAGVTIDVVFQDATVPSGITIAPGASGPGCTFSGYYGTTVSTGWCMDVIMTTTWDFNEVGISVAYDSDNGLAVARVDEWRGLPESYGKLPHTTPCLPVGGVADNGGIIQQFDCIVPPRTPDWPPISAGTYRLGTIIWDTSGFLTMGSETIAAVIAEGDRLIAVINGNVVDVSASVVLGSHLLQIIPEPGTAALLGLGLVGLFLAARRGRLQ